MFYLSIYNGTLVINQWICSVNDDLVSVGYLSDSMLSKRTKFSKLPVKRVELWRLLLNSCELTIFPLWLLEWIIYQFNCWLSVLLPRCLCVCSTCRKAVYRYSWSANISCLLFIAFCGSDYLSLLICDVLASVVPVIFMKYCLYSCISLICAWCPSYELLSLIIIRFGEYWIRGPIGCWGL